MSKVEKKKLEDSEQVEFTFALQLQKNETKSDGISIRNFAISESNDWITLRATAIIGDRFMNGLYIPYDELKKSLSSWNGTVHDISHLGTSYPDTTFPYKRENLDYVIGYQSNVQANDATKEITMDVNIYKKSYKYASWKSFMEINEAAGRIPNVSVAVTGKPVVANASDFGLSTNEKILYLSNIMPRALTTCIQGVCDDKKGCGLSNNAVVEDNKTSCGCNDDKCVNEPSIGGADEKMSDEDAKKLAELKKQIKKLKEE